MQTSKKIHGLKVDDGLAVEVCDQLTVEEPLQIKINGEPFSVTMRTPGDDQVLVKGLLFTEGVLRDPDSSFPSRETPHPTKPCTVAVDVEIPAMFLCHNVFAKRALLSSSSCGLCGVRTLEALELSGELLAPPVPLDLALLPKMNAALRRGQTTFSRTGGTHAAAAFDLTGRRLALYEDIGRHNAVDKVIGSLLEQRRLAEAQVLYVSGRISFEIVMKAHRAGIPILAAVSAPSSLAVELASKAGMTVIGFCRDRRATVYSNRCHVQVSEHELALAE